ncbi:MAG: hypothetical protein MZV70_29955 [Desulfobacterales bacterium]|nr:hypothetical protein [Desulfobacterales bacterium]
MVAPGAKSGILIRDCSNFQGLSERFIRISPEEPRGQPPGGRTAGGTGGAQLDAAA